MLRVGMRYVMDIPCMNNIAVLNTTAVLDHNPVRQGPQIERHTKPRGARGYATETREHKRLSLSHNHVERQRTPWINFKIITDPHPALRADLPLATAKWR